MMVVGVLAKPRPRAALDGPRLNAVGVASGVRKAARGTFERVAARACEPLMVRAMLRELVAEDLSIDGAANMVYALFE